MRTVAVARAQLQRLDRAEVVGQIEPRGNLLAEYVLTSLGPAPARNIRLTLTLGNARSEWKYPLLQVGRSEHFVMPGGHRTFEALEKETARLGIDLRYDDAAGAPQHRAETIQFAELIAGWKSAGWLQFQSEGQELRRTIKEEVRRASDRLTSSIKGCRARARGAQSIDRGGRRRLTRAHRLKRDCGPPG